MSEMLLWMAQFIYIIWPLLIITAVFYAVPGRGTIRALLRRLQSSLAAVWAVLFVAWLVTVLTVGPVQALLPVEPLNTIVFLAGFAIFSIGGLARKLRISPAPLLNALAGIANARSDLLKARAQHDLMQLEPYQFEAVVAETYRQLGYQAWAVGRSGDNGIDVEVRTRTGERWIVQCKRYRDSVGVEYVRALYGTLLHEKAQRAVLVTSADITPPATEWARGKPIDLVDGVELMRMMQKARRRMRTTPLDRAAAWLRAIFNPQRRPAGLQQPGPQAPQVPEERLRIFEPGWQEPARQQAGQTATQPTTGKLDLAGRPRLNGKPFPGDSVVTTVVRSDPQLAERRFPPGDPNSSHTTQPLQRFPDENSPADTQPLRRQDSATPVCPNCKIPMVPRPSRSGDRPGRVLYRCRNYPACRVILEAK